MENSLRDWDYHVAPILRRVEELGYQISTRALEIDNLINRLQMRPEWTTKAEHEMEQAIRFLENHLKATDYVLSKMRTALDNYHETWVENGK